MTYTVGALERRPRRHRGRSKARSSGAGTRADLVAAARTLFSERGYDGASVRAITHAAGANLGAVTYHFGSKRSLYAAVLEQGLRPLAGRVHDVARGEGSALERMLGIVKAYFDHLADNPDLPRLLLQEVAAGKQPPSVVIEIVRSIKEAIAGLQLQGVAEGSVREGHPVLTALSVVSQPVYLALVAPLLRAVGPVDLSHPPTCRMALEHTLAFVRAGLAPKGDPSR